MDEILHADGYRSRASCAGLRGPRAELDLVKQARWGIAGMGAAAWLA
jgi:hypothetical protein